MQNQTSNHTAAAYGQTFDHITEAMEAEIGEHINHADNPIITTHYGYNLYGAEHPQA